MNNTIEYTYLQENGQMKYGGPPHGWVGPAPPKGTEIFISKLPRNASLNEICPVFDQVGPIYSARLMMDFSGTNRGFCFIQYRTRAEARAAIDRFNDFELRPGNKISVIKSHDNCRLFIGQIPKEFGKEEIKEELERITSGLKDVILYLSPTDKSMNRGFCFLEYFNHRSAAMARRQLLANGIPGWGRDVRIDWAIPEVEIEDEIMSQVKVLYVRNLMLKTNEQALKDLVARVVPLNEITRIRKVKDFAFIHFSNRQAAEKVLYVTDGFVLDGAQIHVTWAKPCSDENSNNVKMPKDRNGRNVEYDSSNTNTVVFRYNAGGPVASPEGAAALPFPNQSAGGMGLVYPQPVVAANNLYPAQMYLPMVPNNIHSVIEAHLKEYSPIVALRGLLAFYGLGELQFNITEKYEGKGGHMTTMYSAEVVIRLQGGSVWSPQLFHSPASTPSQAKNLAALVFINSHLQNLIFGYNYPN